jgi:hypothetical protein
MFGQIEAAVQSRDERRRLPREQREGIVVKVEMQKVEIGHALIDSLQHEHVQRIRIADRAVET